MAENRSKSENSVARWPGGRKASLAKSAPSIAGTGPLSAKNEDCVAPSFAAEAERFAWHQLVSGVPAAVVARQLSALGRRPDAEAVLRVVEFGIGPLGRVRPARGEPPAAQPSDPRRPQVPLLGLAAQAFGGRLQRLGDRIYLDGREIEIPALVRLARDGGVRIRYPGLDPMERALSGGPSARRRRPGGTGPAPALLTGGRP